MNVKTWLPLCLSILVGSVVCKIAWDHMNKNKTEGAPTGNTVQLVVAKQGIGAGEELTP